MQPVREEIEAIYWTTRVRGGPLFEKVKGGLTDHPSVRGPRRFDAHPFFHISKLTRTSVCRFLRNNWMGEYFRDAD